MTQEEEENTKAAIDNSDSNYKLNFADSEPFGIKIE